MILHECNFFVCVLVGATDSGKFIIQNSLGKNYEFIYKKKIGSSTEQNIVVRVRQ